MKLLRLSFTLIALIAVYAQQPSLPPTLGLDQGHIDLDTPDFSLRLVKASQTIAALRPKSVTNFDFTPADRSNGAPPTVITISETCCCDFAPVIQEHGNNTTRRSRASL